MWVKPIPPARIAPPESPWRLANFTTSNVFLADLTKATFTAGIARHMDGAIAGSDFDGVVPVRRSQRHRGGAGNPYWYRVRGVWRQRDHRDQASGDVWLWDTRDTRLGDMRHSPTSQNGFDPHTVTAYQSPNGAKDAIALLANGTATSLAVVDLTKMLNPAIVPRTSGAGLGHACASTTLPATVVSFVPVPGAASARKATAPERPK